MGQIRLGIFVKHYIARCRMATHVIVSTLVRYRLVTQEFQGVPT